jgi:hypothetical protein
MYTNPKNSDLEKWKNMSKHISQNLHPIVKKEYELLSIQHLFLSNGFTKQWFDLDNAVENILYISICMIVI